MKKRKFKVNRKEIVRVERYFYRGDDGDWKPFTLDKEYGKMWNQFCIKLSMNRTDKPFPELADLEEFRESLKQLK